MNAQLHGEMEYCSCALILRFTEHLRSDFMSVKRKLVTNVVKRRYNLLVTFKDGHKEVITVEAESLAAAGLLLPHDAEKWIPIEDKEN